MEVAVQLDSCSADLCNKVGQIVLCALRETWNMPRGDFSCYFPAALCSMCNAESLHSARAYGELYKMIWLFVTMQQPLLMSTIQRLPTHCCVQTHACKPAQADRQTGNVSRAQVNAMVYYQWVVQQLQRVISSNRSALQQTQEVLFISSSM